MRLIVPAVYNGTCCKQLTNMPVQLSTNNCHIDFMNKQLRYEINTSGGSK